MWVAGRTSAIAHRRQEVPDHPESCRELLGLEELLAYASIQRGGGDIPLPSLG
jgi:hypothetical protein